MYKKVDSKLVQPELEKNVLQFWDEEKIFEKVTNSNSSSKAFVFYDGPPGVNGKPHIGHVSNRIYKDIILRYKTMQGFRVLRKAGWDAHGLPVELQAEKELNFKNKQDIEKFGLENFVNKCKSIVSQYRQDWSESTRKIGYWVDLEKAYIT
ncbi:MAG: class I tRNA ligase family protein, partial [Clostridia bacterium]|nr:class I tRNA ligase family protein [Clostridia bacterium]